MSSITVYGDNGKTWTVDSIDGMNVDELGNLHLFDGTEVRRIFRHDVWRHAERV